MAAWINWIVEVLIHSILAGMSMFTLYFLCEILGY